jgi:hypothetical protein
MHMRLGMLDHSVYKTEGPPPRNTDGNGVLHVVELFLSLPL